MSGVKGKSRVCGSNTCLCLPCGYVALRAVLLKVSLGYVALALMYLFALRIYGFTGSVRGNSRVCGSSTRVFVCPAGMWLYGRCC
jgi:hypothetical protein